LILLPLSAAAAAVYNTDLAKSDYTGYRTNSNGLEASGIYSSGFQIDWNINQTGSTFFYTYTFSGYGGNASGISHLILELSANCTAACVQYPTLGDDDDVTTETRLYEPTDPGKSNPGLPGEIFGIKLTMDSADAPATLSFESSRRPVWGNFYLKGGNAQVSLSKKSNPQPVAENFVYNLGFKEENHDSSNTAFFIARPDTFGSQVPEPSSIALIGTGLCCVAWSRKLISKFRR